jgi:hypothetical protein
MRTHVAAVGAGVRTMPRVVRAEMPMSAYRRVSATSRSPCSPHGRGDQPLSRETATRAAMAGSCLYRGPDGVGQADPSHLRLRRT